MDLFHLEKQPLQAFDVGAGRLRALIHFDLTGRWKEAEQLQADSARGTGLVDFEDVYRARRVAKLTVASSSSGSDEDEGGPKKKNKNKNKKRGKNKKKKKKETKKKGENAADDK